MANSTFVTGKNLPPPDSPFVDPKTGVLSSDGNFYVLGLINQLANAIPTASIAQGLAATGTTQATALLLSSQWNEVNTAAVNANGVLLAGLQPGQSQTVFNDTGLGINVYPPPGAQIDALGANQPYALASGSRRTFDFFSSVQIR